MPDGAEFVDHNRGVGALRRRQEIADQRGLAGAEKAGDDRDRNARAALTPLPPAERADCGGREELRQRFNQKSISRMYSPPTWRSTV